MINNNLKTPRKWCEIYNIKILDFTEFGGESNFISKLYDNQTFLYLASKSKVETQKSSSPRRDAFKLKRKLENTSDNFEKA